MTPGRPLVTLAIPCRTDEPGLGRTLADALTSWRHAAAARTHDLEVLVCLNGAPHETPRAAVRALAAAENVPCTEIDLDAGDAVALPARARGRAVAVLATRRAGKPHAWNVLRRVARAPIAVFMDADVSFGPDALGLLLDALAAHPEAALASGTTTCAPRAGRFERIMAVPYAVGFANLSPQLYAARLASLPSAVPEDLFDQERWLELTVGRAGLVRVPAVAVTVRLPGTLGDFFRQRIRIEMGKVQLARVYPGLSRRGAPPPGLAALAGALGPLGSARAGVYLGLRALAHAVAWWRYRRGATADVWRQAASTKSWDAA